MTTTEIAEHFTDHPFIDRVDCLDMCIKAARYRSKLAVRATKNNEPVVAARHREMAQSYLLDARNHRSMIEWDDEE